MCSGFNSDPKKRHVHVRVPRTSLPCIAPNALRCTVTRERQRLLGQKEATCPRRQAPQAQECQEPQGAGRQGGFSRQAPGGSSALPTPWLQAPTSSTMRGSASTVQAARSVAVHAAVLKTEHCEPELPRGSALTRTHVTLNTCSFKQVQDRRRDTRPPR